MNRHSRTLLVILVVAAVIIPYWYLSRRSTLPVGTNVGSGKDPASTGLVAERGGQIVASTRSDPRSFNRLTQPDVLTDMISMLTLGRLVRINRATTELEPWASDREHADVRAG